MDVEGGIYFGVVGLGGVIVVEGVDGFGGEICLECFVILGLV